MTQLSDLETLEILVVLIVFIAGAFYLADPCHLRKTEKKSIAQYYSYTGPNGPSQWKQQYTESNGTHQSPINIGLYTIIVPADCGPAITFSAEYNITPKEMSIYNDGYSVILYARWNSTSRPKIVGGPCKEQYEFLNGRFRWGPTDEEGSEHTIECKAFAMEFQAVHVKSGKFYSNLSQAAEDNALLVVSYFYEITPVINPYLQPLITALAKVKNPHVCTCIEPLPLFFLMPSFVCKYVSYEGSLTHPPCTQGVLWIIQTEPLGISSPQVEQFRKLNSFCGSLVTNRRPVQNVNGRDIAFYE